MKRITRSDAAKQEIGEGVRIQVNGDGMYARPRTLPISITAAILAGVAVGIGFPRGALGVAAGLPVALLNHFLMVRATRRTEGKDIPASQAQLTIFSWSLARMGISLAALLASISMGAEFIIGMLAALLSEMVSHIGETVRMLARSRR